VYRSLVDQVCREPFAVSRGAASTNGKRRTADKIRTTLAAALTLAFTLPALVGSAWIFGCCVLPFHRSMHQALPLCHMAAAASGGESSRQPPSTAPREREQRVAVRAELTPAPHAVAPRARQSRIVAASRIDYRSFISLGATRCDRDVGLQILLATFLI